MRGAASSNPLRAGASHLPNRPREAVADVGDAEAEALGAALRVSLLQVVESRFAAVAVFPFDIVLQVREKIALWNQHAKADRTEGPSQERHLVTHGGSTHTRILVKTEQTRECERNMAC